MKELYLITGFLGAGKTTFVNHAVEIFHDKRIAIIVNEFGKQGIDGGLISKNGYDVSEISNGSIFCVCRSDLFIDALKDALSSQIDVLIVETSGLSNPTGIDEILAETKKVTGESFDYKGCVCIIDAVNFNRVLSTVVVVPDQIKQSSLILVNKIDLVNDQVLNDIKAQIIELNPHCDIVFTSYSKITSGDITNLAPIKEKVMGGKVDISSVSLTFNILNAITKVQFDGLINALAPLVYRVKGYVTLEDKYYFVDGVMDKIMQTQVETTQSEGVVLLYQNTSPVRKMLKGYCKDNGIEVEVV